MLELKLRTLIPMSQECTTKSNNGRRMRYKNPAQEGHRPVVLASLYPFVREASSPGTLSAASLKLECLIQKECTIPGSLALEDVEIRWLLRKNVELLKSEALTIDLRNTVNSFNELVDIKYGVTADREIREMAEFLDENCASVLHFDPDGASSAYKVYLKNSLASLHKSAVSLTEKRALERVVNKLEKIERPRLVDGQDLYTGTKRTDTKIDVITKFWYCVCGSEFVHGTAQVPHDLWTAANQYIELDHIDPTCATYSSELSTAHAAVLEHFAINAKAFDRLSSEDIVALRDDGATRKMLTELQEVIEKAQREILEQRGTSVYTMKHFSDCQARITDAVRKQCLVQAKRSGLSEYGIMGTEEGISLGAGALDYVLPGIGFLRKGMLRIGRIVSRKSPRLSGLDFTLSPIQTYVSRIQARISQNV